ncbi:flagellar protein FlaG [Massilia sp. YIM B02443]|uniref:flagellar protein FlaG n=1 Tax=Massilia sp. YIM B02443 TaxID=3050127 RepID=UPI0025B65AFD|nr:flagellar protein FlaG [Massilia sp. YIM B02443]MDN4035779.1 flagellar protein FlaG [Massilia sp. YIM B02443]
MQIHTTGLPLTPRLDERPAAAAESGAVAGRPVRPESDMATTPPSKEDVSAAVDKLNEAMQVSSQSLKFEIDDDTKQIVVKIIDQSTQEVVRQMPTEEALQMAKSIDKMQGLLIRQTA